MQEFAELGEMIERCWREENYKEDCFQQIAAQALSDAKLVDRVSTWDIVRWVHTSSSLPEQMDLDGAFGNPPITLFMGPRFYIDVYYWLDGTTSIHQHAFSGAFQVLLGSSVHARYDFDKHKEVNPHFLTGKISLREVSLLKKGDIREILAGPAFIHSLFHLDRPSATITVRTMKAPRAAIQYSYLVPYLGRNPFFIDPLLKRKIQTVELLLHMKHPEADKFISDIIASSDFQTAFSVLDKAFGFLCHRELEEMMGVSRSRERFQALLDCAFERHGDLAELLLPVFEEEWRQNDIAQRRTEIKSEDHRFFLALLLNVPDRTNVLRLVSERFSQQDPIGLIVGWVEELVATKTFGSREPNVLGIGEFDHNDLLVFRRLLEGSSEREGELDLADTGTAESIEERATRIKSLPLFKSLFNQA